MLVREKPEDTYEDIDYEHEVGIDEEGDIHVFGELLKPISLADIKPAKVGNKNLKFSWIQILREGRWKHPVYGLVDINQDTFKALKEHHEQGIRGIDIAIDTEHKEDKGAVGWIKKLEVRPNGLWAFVEWTRKGIGLIQDKVYRYVSAEFSPKYEDTENGQTIPNVLIATTLTNRPFIKRMAPILLSEITPGLRDRMLAEWDLEQYKNNLIEPFVETTKHRFSRTKNTEFVEKEGDVSDTREHIKSLKLKRKKGGRHMLRNQQEVELGDLDSGLDMDEDDFAQLMEIPEEDTQEYYEEEPEYYQEEPEAQEYYEEEPEYYYEEPEEDAGYEFTEPVQTADPAARRATMQLSEQVMQLQEQNVQLQEALKFEAVEGIVNEWIEDSRGVGRIPPQHRDLATHMMMKLSDEDAGLFRQFVENLPGCFDYAERGITAQEEMQSGDLQFRARQIFAEGQKLDNAYQFRDALKQAYMELQGS